MEGWKVVDRGSGWYCSWWKFRHNQHHRWVLFLGLQQFFLTLIYLVVTSNSSAVFSTLILFSRFLAHLSAHGRKYVACGNEEKDGFSSWRFRGRVCPAALYSRCHPWEFITIWPCHTHVKVIRPGCKIEMVLCISFFKNPVVAYSFIYMSKFFIHYFKIVNMFVYGSLISVFF